MRALRRPGALALAPLLGLLLALLLALGACAPAPSGEPVMRPPDELRAATTELRAGAATLSMEVEAWRSFQPLAGDAGDPLIAILRIRAAGDGRVPGALGVADVYLVRGNEVVRGEAREEQPRAANAGAVEFVLRDGPRWAPGDSIDVIVGVTGIGGESVLLRAPRVAIARVD